MVEHIAEHKRAERSPLCASLQQRSDGRKEHPPCAHFLLHRGFTGGYPNVIQSFYSFLHGERSNNAQHSSLSSHTFGRMEGSMRLRSITILNPEPRASSSRTRVTSPEYVSEQGSRAMYRVYPGWYIVVYTREEYQPPYSPWCIYGDTPLFPTYPGVYTGIPFSYPPWCIYGDALPTHPGVYTGIPLPTIPTLVYIRAYPSYHTHQGVPS